MTFIHARRNVKKLSTGRSKYVFRFRKVGTQENLNIDDMKPLRSIGLTFTRRITKQQREKILNSHLFKNKKVTVLN